MVKKSLPLSIRIFDGAHPEVVRKPLPRILLIDEFKFRTEYSKYCCHLVDFEASESVDVIRSRQKAYLDEYFGRIGENERKRVKVLVT
jgi:transposase